MDYDKLHAELTVDPLGRGYAAMSNQAAADSLNVVNRSVPHTSITGGELLACTIVAEVTALTAPARDMFLALIQMISLDITSANVRAILGGLFGADTTTRTNLVALATSTIPLSRATELSLPFVGAHHVAYARSMA